MNKIALVFMLLLVYPFLSFTPEKSRYISETTVQATMSNLVQIATKLNDLRSKATVEEQKKIDEVYESLNRFNILLQTYQTIDQANNPLSGSADYQTTTNNYKSLTKSISFSDDIKQIFKTISFIVDDIKLKIEAEVEGEQEYVVRVSVRDLKNNELPGYYAYAKPYLSADPLNVLNFNPTNEAVHGMSAGWKLFWIRKDGIVVDSTDRHISKDTTTRLVIFKLNK